MLCIILWIFVLVFMLSVFIHCNVYIQNTFDFIAFLVDIFYIALKYNVFYIYVVFLLFFSLSA